MNNHTLQFTAQEAPHGLLCNRLDRPLGVNARNVNLSWDFSTCGAQEYYQLEIATHVDAFTDGGPLAWDSGQVYSEDSSATALPPFILLDNTTYYWRVRVGMAGGRVSEWSVPQRIVTAAAIH